jgi:hypothetical protein
MDLIGLFEVSHIEEVEEPLKTALTIASSSERRKRGK